MPTYTATQRRDAPKGHGFGGSMKVAFGEIVCSAAPTTSDPLEFFELPAGARVVGGFLEADDLDTGGSPSIALNIGDAGDADRFFAASTVAQAGTASTALAVAGLGHRFADRTLITGVASANAATGAAGNIRLALFYVLD